MRPLYTMAGGQSEGHQADRNSRRLEAAEGALQDTVVAASASGCDRLTTPRKQSPVSSWVAEKGRSGTTRTRDECLLSTCMACSQVSTTAVRPRLTVAHGADTLTLTMGARRGQTLAGLDFGRVPLGHAVTRAFTLAVSSPRARARTAQPHMPRLVGFPLPIVLRRSSERTCNDQSLSSPQPPPRCKQTHTHESLTLEIATNALAQQHILCPLSTVSSRRR